MPASRTSEAGRPPRRLLVLNQYYAPDPATTGQHAAAICEALAARGDEVTVITAQPSYLSSGGAAPAQEVLNGVSVQRVAMGRWVGRDALAVRVLGYLRYLGGAVWRGRRALRSRPHDWVVGLNNPPFIGAVGAVLARRHGVPLAYVPHDIHPDVLEATGWIRLPRPLLAAWEAVNRFTLRTADVVIVIGEGMKRTLVEKGADPHKVHVIPLWANPELRPDTRDQPLRQELGIGDDLLLVYAGNIGIMHPLEPLLDAAGALAGEPVQILLVGEGARREHWRDEAERRGLSNVRFLGFQHGEAYRSLMAAADLQVVALGDGLERLAVPSRSYTALSAGCPLLTIMAPDADMAALVTSEGCGWNVRSGDELVALVQALREDPASLAEAGRRARAVWEERYDRSSVLAEYTGLLS